MEPASSADVTTLLCAVKHGDLEARSVLASLVYNELRRIARRRMRSERENHTLQPTALVNEAYMQLVAQEDKTWQNRSHFYAVAAQLMRRMLIDHARAARARKRGGGDGHRIPLDFDVPVDAPNIDEMLAVDTALARLQQLDARQAQVVEMRYFAGMTEEEVAEALGVSPRTIKRDWNMARSFLRNEIRGTAAGAS